MLFPPHVLWRPHPLSTQVSGRNGHIRGEAVAPTCNSFDNWGVTWLTQNGIAVFRLLLDGARDGLNLFDHMELTEVLLEAIQEFKSRDSASATPFAWLGLPFLSRERGNA